MHITTNKSYFSLSILCGICYEHWRTWRLLDIMLIKAGCDMNSNAPFHSRFDGHNKPSITNHHHKIPKTTHKNLTSHLIWKDKKRHNTIPIQNTCSPHNKYTFENYESTGESLHRAMEVAEESAVIHQTAAHQSWLWYDTINTSQPLWQLHSGQLSLYRPAGLKHWPVLVSYMDGRVGSLADCGSAPAHQSRLWYDSTDTHHSRCDDSATSLPGKYGSQ